MEQFPDQLPPSPVQYASMPTQPPGQGKATASLILGICSVVMWLCPLVGIAVAITGLVLGIQSNREHRRKTAVAGIVLSIIGLALTVVNGAIGAYLGATGQHSLVNRFIQPAPAPQPAQPATTP